MSFARRSAGWLRLTGWLWLVHVATRPWRELGGLVDERTRWLVWALLGVLGVAGWFAGAYLRDATRPLSRWRAVASRRLLLLPTAGVALSMVLLRVRGADDAIGVVLVGWIAWVGALDAAYSAIPLVRGRACGQPGPDRG